MKIERAQKYLIRLSVASGESLSSFRQRVAWANGLRHYPFEYRNRPSDDVDLPTHVGELEWVAFTHSGTQPNLFTLSYQALVPYLSTRPYSSVWQPWLLSNKTKLGISTCRSVYCPFCLRDDVEPYFRLSWRLSYYTTCKTHGCRVLDGCPNCGEIVWPIPIAYRKRSNRKFLSFSICWSCGVDLSSANVQSGDPATQLAHMLFADDTLNTVKNHQVFDLIYARCHALLNVGGPRKNPKRVSFDEQPIAIRNEVLNKALTEHHRQTTEIMHEAARLESPSTFHS